MSGALRQLASRVGAGLAALGASTGISSTQAGPSLVDVEPEDISRFIFSKPVPSEEKKFEDTTKDLELPRLAVSELEVQRQLEGIDPVAVVKLGAQLAEDPAVQAAILKKFGGSEMLEKYLPYINSSAIGEEKKKLEDELEWQQTLNEDLTYHADRLADEKIKLKDRVKMLEKEKSQLERKNSELERELDERRRIIDNNCCHNSSISSSSSSSGINMSRRSFQHARLGGILREEMQQQGGNEEEDEEEQASPSFFAAALGVAAVIIAMVMLRKVPQATVVKAAFATVAGMFMRPKSP